MLILLSALALAAPEIGTHAGMLKQGLAGERGVAGLDASWRVADAFAVTVRGGGVLDLVPDGRLLVRQIDEERWFLSQVSPVRTYGAVGLELVPLTGQIGLRDSALPLAVGLIAGVGVVRTVDDLDLLMAWGEPSAMATEREWHPTLEYGLTARVTLTDRMSFRAEARALSYVETIDSITLEARTPATITGGLVWRLGGGERQPAPCPDDEPCEDG